MIERSLITGLIVSTDFISQIYHIFNYDLLESPTTQLLSRWCLEYYENYKQAPGSHIQTIYAEKLKNNQVGKNASDIEQILNSISQEYVESGINVEYLVTKTKEHFTRQKLIQLSDDIQDNVQSGNIKQAEAKISEYKQLSTETKQWVDLGGKEIYNVIDRAYQLNYEPVIEYGRALGELLNTSLVKGGFVIFHAPSKRGKTFQLLEAGMRAFKQKRKVAFFQAGDMMEHEQVIRAGIHLSGKSDMEKHSGVMFDPVRDCVYNQIDDCNQSERECDFGIFEGWTEDQVRDEVTYEDLCEAYKDNPDYKPCTNCPKYKGTIWYKQIDTGTPITSRELKSVFRKRVPEKHFRIASYPNGTLTLSGVEAQLTEWELQDGFVPELIIIDYMDLLAHESSYRESRDQINDTWKKARKLSQEKHALVLSATQGDALSHEQDSLRLKNFSDDRRKFDHVTAWFTLNRDKDGREKDLGMIRIGELLKRGDDYNINNEVRVLQNLRRGQPVLSSFW